MIQEAGVVRCDLTVNFKAKICPAADPVTIMQVGVPCVSIAHKSFVVTATRAYGTRPARLTIVLGIDVSALQKVLLFI